MNGRCGTIALLTNSSVASRCGYAYRGGALEEIPLPRILITSVLCYDMEKLMIAFSAHCFACLFGLQQTRIQEPTNGDNSAFNGLKVRCCFKVDVSPPSEFNA